ncbi:MAG: FMN-binding negative transcriptional regulator [Rhodospirillaceae bacterium]
MYQPAHFVEPRLSVKHDLIRAYPFGLMISVEAGLPVANAIPFVLDAGAGPLGVLRGHVARSNPQWQGFQASPEALAVFQGAHTYITPSWYQTKRETGKAVPTWNYIMVQARGKMRVIEDRNWLLAQVTALTDTHEGPRAEPWRVTDAPASYLDAMLKGIVGLELEIASLDGKWKVSQNRSREDVSGVIEGLEAQDHPHAQDLAKLALERLPD